MIRRLTDRLIAVTEPLAMVFREHADEIVVAGVSWLLIVTLLHTGL